MTGRGVLWVTSLGDRRVAAVCPHFDLSRPAGLVPGSSLSTGPEPGRILRVRASWPKQVEIKACLPCERAGEMFVLCPCGARFMHEAPGCGQVWCLTGGVRGCM